MFNYYKHHETKSQERILPKSCSRNLVDNYNQRILAFLNRMRLNPVKVDVNHSQRSRKAITQITKTNRSVKVIKHESKKEDLSFEMHYIDDFKPVRSLTVPVSDKLQKNVIDTQAIQNALKLTPKKQSQFTLRPLTKCKQYDKLHFVALKQLSIEEPSMYDQNVPAIAKQVLTLCRVYSTKK